MFLKNLANMSPIKTLSLFANLVCFASDKTFSVYF